jgi:integrase
MISALDQAADEHLINIRPANTTRTYAAGWKTWVNYCETLEIPETSNSRGPLVGFIVQQGRAGYALTTIDSRMSAVIVGLRQRNSEPDADTRTAVREAFSGLKRALAEKNDKRGRGQAAPLLIDRLRRIVAACPDSTAGIRDRALVTVAFGIAARRSEIANLLITDIETERRGLLVNVRFGKTGQREVQITAQPGSPTCASAAWIAWHSILGETEGPAFRCVHRSGRILGGMRPKAAGEIITRAARRADIEVRMTGHSARAGLVTEATNAGHQPDIIARTTGHSPNSKVLWAYRRVEDGWGNNATNGIGL